MDLKKVAFYLKEASKEIKQLKEENADLKQKVAEMGKVASVNEENDFIGFGNVDNDRLHKTPNNAMEEFMSYFS